MIPSFDKVLPPSHFSLEETYNLLINYLLMQTDGKNYASGIDDSNHLKISLQLIAQFEEDNLDNKKIDLLILCLDALKLFHTKNNNFKSDPNLTFPIRQEKNLLEILFDKKNIGRHVFSGLYKLLYDSLELQLSQQARLGQFLLCIGLESGCFSTSHLSGLLAALQSETKIHNLEGLYFIDYPLKDSSSKFSYVFRVFLDPLSATLFCKSEGFYDFLSKNSSKTSSVKALINACFKSFLSETQGLNHSLTIGTLKSRIRLAVFLRLPGFIFGVADNFTPSFCLSLSRLAALHGLDSCGYKYPWPVENAAYEGEAIDDDFEDSIDDDIDESEEEKQKQPRRINTRFFSPQEYDHLIELIHHHPALSPRITKQFEYVLGLSFFCGTRRGEALFSRCCDIYPMESEYFSPEIFLREYEGRRLKNTTSARRIALNLLPEATKEFILDRTDPASPALIVGRTLSKSQEIHFFTKLNSVLKLFFRDNVGIHSARHSFVSNGILKICFALLRFDNLIGESSFLRELEKTAAHFRRSLGASDFDKNLLYVLSQSAGHAAPPTTLRSYMHCMDFLIFGGMSSTRQPGFQNALSTVSGISERTLQRHAQNDPSRFSQFFLHLKKKHPDCFFVIDQKIDYVELNDLSALKLIIPLLRDLDDELSLNETIEVIRLFKMFPPTKIDIEFISYLFECINPIEAYFNLSNRALYSRFTSMCRRCRVEPSEFEWKPAKRDRTYQYVQLSNFKEAHQVSSKTRLRFPNIPSDKQASLPRRVFRLYVAAIYFNLTKINLMMSSSL